LADDGPDGGVQSERVTVILPAYLNEWVEKKAAEQTISKSGYVRMQLARVRRSDIEESKRQAG